MGARAWWGVLGVACALAGAGCGDSGCPAGSREEMGRCVASEDGGADAGPADAGPADAGSDACTLRTFYADEDGDGHGDRARPVEACSLPAGAAAQPNDCDDTLDTVRPGAPESCDGVDEDCDGRFDEGWKLADFFPDDDGDGHGAVGSAAVPACMAPAGHAATADDCDDANAGIAPGASEVCNGADEDCDGASDEGLQRLIGTPREVVPLGQAAEYPAHMIPLGDGYAVLYAQYSPTPSIRALRLTASGAAAGTSAELAADFRSRYQQLVGVDGTRVIALYTAPISTDIGLFARSVDFGTDPPALGTEVEIEVARGSDPFAFADTTAVLLGSRLVVLYEVYRAQVQARSYSTTLDAATAPVVVLPFEVERMVATALPGATTATLVYSARRPGDETAQVYLDRVLTDPLAVEGRAFQVSDGRARASGGLASGPSGEVGIAIGYDDVTGELVRAQVGPFGTVPVITSRTSLELRGTRSGTAVPRTAYSIAGYDVVLGVGTSAPPEALHWQFIDRTLAPATTLGAAHYIPSVSVARHSSQRGALLWVATATADTRQHVLFQQLGCE